MSDVITVICRVIRGALLFLGYPPVAPGGDGDRSFCCSGSHSFRSSSSSSGTTTDDIDIDVLEPITPSPFVSASKVPNLPGPGCPHPGTRSRFGQERSEFGAEPVESSFRAEKPFQKA